MTPEPISLGLIATLAVPFVLFIAWVGRLQARVTRNEKDIADLSGTPERLARIEAHVEHIRHHLDNS